MLKFMFDIEPVQASRPRFSRRGGFVKAYIPKKQRDFQTTVTQMAKAQFKDKMFVDENLKVTLQFFIAPPKQVPKYKQVWIEQERLYDHKRPDIDNLIKLPIDACIGVIFKDDNCIVEVSGIKKYSYHPRIEMTIEVLNEPNRKD